MRKGMIRSVGWQVPGRFAAPHRLRRWAVGLAIAAAGALGLDACAVMTPVHATSLSVLTPQLSTLRIAAPRNQVVLALQHLMSRQGFELVDRRPAPNGDLVYLFHGVRSRVTVGGGGGFTVYEVGSFFLARMQERDEGVVVTLVGIPAGNNQPICSDADALVREVGVECRPVRATAESPLRQVMTGREEATVVRSVLVTLSEAAEAAGVSPEAAAPARDSNRPPQTW